MKQLYNDFGGKIGKDIVGPAFFVIFPNYKSKGNYHFESTYPGVKLLNCTTSFWASEDKLTRMSIKRYAQTTSLF